MTSKRSWQTRCAMNRERAVSPGARPQGSEKRARRRDRFPGEDVDLVTADEQSVDEMPLSLALHQCPRPVWDPKDPHLRLNDAQSAVECHARPHLSRTQLRCFIASKKAHER